MNSAQPSKRDGLLKLFRALDMLMEAANDYETEAGINSAMAEDERLQERWKNLKSEHLRFKQAISRQHGGISFER